MRLFAFKLSDGFYYRSGHAVGQRLHIADIHEEDDLMNIGAKTAFIKERIDPDFQLVEVIIKEKE